MLSFANFIDFNVPSHAVTPLEIMTVFLASVFHDLGHPGVNSVFLSNSHNHIVGESLTVLLSSAFAAKLRQDPRNQHTKHITLTKVFNLYPKFSYCNTV